MRALTLMFLVAVLAACAPQSEIPVAGFINLDDLQPLPTSEGEHVQPLRVAIAAVISPQGTAESYAPLVDYLGERLKRPIEILQRRTYAEINELLRTGDVDLAFVCTSSYILGRREFGLELLVAPQVNGETTYRAKLIIPAESAARSIEDLRGKVFAFTDPNSFSGRIFPTFLLQQIGETPEEFFARTFFTYSHDDAIYAVANGAADGASVDSLILDYVLERDPSLVDRLRIINTSPPFGIPPVVVRPDINLQLRAELKAIFLGMDKTPDGLAALTSLGVDRFVEVTYEDYRSAEEVETQVISSESKP